MTKPRPIYPTPMRNARPAPQTSHKGATMLVNIGALCGIIALVLVAIILL